MSDNNNFKPNLEGYKPLRPFNLFMKNNFPFIENTFEALDTYGLICQLVKYLNTVIENEKATEHNVSLLSNAFNQLNDYVSHYFDNLDVQEEIDNKLDAMVESGTLQEIIAEYLNSKAVFGFDSVADMKSATNLIDGSYAKTLGFNSVNDKGQALYQIREKTNEDVIDEITKIEIEDTDLIAVLINNEINHIMVFNEDLEKAIANSKILYLDEKTYNVTISNSIIKDNIKIYGNGAKINSTSNVSYLFNLSNSYVEKVYFKENNISDKTKNYIMTGNNNRFKECEFESTIGYHNNNLENITFENCIFNNYYREINMGYGQLKNLKVLNCDFIRNQDYDSPYVGDRRIVIYNYDGSNIALKDSVLEDYGEFIEIKNCNFAPCNSRQIHLFNIHHVEIENCNFNESGLNSTELGGSDDSVVLDFVKYFKVNNNYFGNSGENNLDILSSSNGEIKNNLMEKPYDYYSIDINWSDYVRTYGHSLEDDSILRSSDVIISNNTINNDNTYVINITPSKNIHLFDNNITKINSGAIISFQDFGSLTSSNPSGLKVEAVDIGRNNVKTSLGNYGTVGALYQTHSYIIDVNSGHLSEDICSSVTQTVTNNQQIFITTYFPSTHGSAYKLTSLGTLRSITPSITTWDSTNSKSTRNGIDLVGNAYNTNSWNVVFNSGEYVDRVPYSYTANLDSSYVYQQTEASIIFKVW